MTVRNHLLATVGRGPVPPGVPADLVGELGCYLVFELAQLVQDRLVP
jgi:hypothetical protein